MTITGTINTNLVISPSVNLGEIIGWAILRKQGDGPYTTEFVFDSPREAVAFMVGYYYRGE